MSVSETPSPTPGSPPAPVAASSSRAGALERTRAMVASRKSIWAAAAGLLVLAGALAAVFGARAHDEVFLVLD